MFSQIFKIFTVMHDNAFNYSSWDFYFGSSPKNLISPLKTKVQTKIFQ